MQIRISNYVDILCLFYLLYQLHINNFKSLVEYKVREGVTSQVFVTWLSGTVLSLAKMNKNIKERASLDRMDWFHQSYRNYQWAFIPVSLSESYNWSKNGWKVISWNCSAQFTLFCFKASWEHISTISFLVWVMGPWVTTALPNRLRRVLVILHERFLFL